MFWLITQVSCFHPYWTLLQKLLACIRHTDGSFSFYRRWGDHPKMGSHFCPLWVFLRSGLAVPKAVARKPLPQKVSALDSGIWSRHHLSFPWWSREYLPSLWVFQSEAATHLWRTPTTRKIVQNLRLSKAWPKLGVAFDPLWNTRMGFWNKKHARGVAQDVAEQMS